MKNVPKEAKTPIKTMSNGDNTFKKCLEKTEDDFHR